MKITTQKLARALVLILSGLPAACSCEQYVISIGISAYPKLDNSVKLHFAATDAALFAQTMKQLGVPDKNIKLVTEENANREGIFNAITWGARRATSEDVVYIFFSGHGIPSEDGQTYFLPWDGSSSDPAALGIRADEFFGKISQSIGSRVVLFIDACHAGSAFSQNGATKAGTAPVPTRINRAIDAASPDDNSRIRVAILSSASNEFSYEDFDMKQGVFAHFLIEGLNGAKGQSVDHGIVTAQSLYHYLLDNVEIWASAHKHEQSPMRSVAWIANLPIVQFASDSPDPDARSSTKPNVIYSSLQSPGTTKGEMQHVPMTETPPTYKFNDAGEGDLKARVISGLSGRRKEAILLAFDLKDQNVPYVWGGKTPRAGFDGSGFVAYVLNKVGVIDNPGSYWSGKLRQRFRPAARLEVGDIIFYADGSCYFYLGNDLAMGMTEKSAVDLFDLAANRDYSGTGHVTY